jgi:hypothetical protein
MKRALGLVPEGPFSLWTSKLLCCCELEFGDHPYAVGQCECVRTWMSSRRAGSEDRRGFRAWNLSAALLVVECEGVLENKDAALAGTDRVAGPNVHLPT